MPQGLAGSLFQRSYFLSLSGSFQGREENKTPVPLGSPIKSAVDAEVGRPGPSARQRECREGGPTDYCFKSVTSDVSTDKYFITMKSRTVLKRRLLPVSSGKEASRWVPPRQRAVRPGWPLHVLTLPSQRPSPLPAARPAGPPATPQALRAADRRGRQRGRVPSCGVTPHLTDPDLRPRPRPSACQQFPSPCGLRASDNKLHQFYQETMTSYSHQVNGKQTTQSQEALLYPYLMAEA